MSSERILPQIADSPDCDRMPNGGDYCSAVGDQRLTDFRAGVRSDFGLLVIEMRLVLLPQPPAT
jgi:hypothetical protein